ncbi:hypothetical protein P4159_06015 [Bacillus thuringiensis]|uniref:hypothetical protein n=1 Tax=Bacillus cereus group TaxID=86661 RepID=UPI000CD8579E|nr:MULTISPECIES: hypothetical protein [Bacillus cereus group]MEC3420528.1 hypothetical protein [Bacillus cereus]MEC3596938.1 hypothetical protein [Bacillus thuringiensis]MED1574287.1 hypothetical protein [Bacillus paranthracis]MED1836211.1 hypothetical protein [Bacillus thuringiensis]MED2670274.1 hypothetical protein [Bacillus thuringiensis]
MTTVIGTILGVIIAVAILLGLWALRVAIAAGIAWAIVTVFGWVANFVDVDIYSAYDKGTIILCVTAILVVYSMINGMVKRARK